MDVVLIAIAFAFGLAAQQFRLPPLVGFLLAGFALRALGQEGGEGLAVVSDLGVTLLLFTIGLKLRVRSLMRPEIWAGTSLHALLVVVIFFLLLLGLSYLGIRSAGLEPRTVLLLAFALSFSSTVFAVKTLTESGHFGSMSGRIAIGILIMQDILAVVFLTASTGKLPSPWALLLVPAFLLARPVMGWLLARSGHGELTTLCGLFLALVVGAAGFEWVGLKADLGALFVGVLVGWHPRSKELGKSLTGLTDLFLVGFFLQIGLGGAITWQVLGWAALFLLLLPLKSVLFFGLLTRFRLRARTAWRSGLTLSTYSEFGLIVMALAVQQGWASGDWLVVVAVALALSFLVAAPLNRRAEELYDPISTLLRKLETRGRHADDLPVLQGSERIAIFGMGRVGLAAFGILEHRFPGRVIGFDRDPAAVEAHHEAERNVLLADATDSDFWERVCVRDDLDLVVLAMPNHRANVQTLATLQRHHFHGVVVATGLFQDQVKELRSLGADTAFNLYSEAGAGFANHVFNVFNQQRPDLVHEWARATKDG